MAKSEVSEVSYCATVFPVVLTCNGKEGEFVPIPTLPSVAILTFSVLPGLNVINEPDAVLPRSILCSDATSVVEP